MQGTIKKYYHDKGYGFITVLDSKDYFFHVSQVIGSNPPTNGVSVSFTPIIKDGGNLAAEKVIVDSLNNTHKKINDKPFYASPTYKTTKEIIRETRSIWIILLSIIFSVFAVKFDSGSNGVIFAIILAIIFGIKIGTKEKTIEKKSVITSKCIRCSGTGHVTARTNGKIGFQCMDCKHFWTKRDIY